MGGRLMTGNGKFLRCRNGCGSIVRSRASAVHSFGWWGKRIEGTGVHSLGREDIMLKAVRLHGRTHQLIVLLLVLISLNDGLL